MTDGPIKIGLEIHIQLSGNKLFCRCSTEGKMQNKGQFDRVMGSVSGELGQTDPAVLYEKKRARSFRYIPSDNSCLVEADEEPPLPVNTEALKRALATSLYLKSTVPDRIEFMRKIVVDGSNTSGFQRTAIVSLGGKVDTPEGVVRVSSICLEEDSCRKVEQQGADVVYSLDRLGIPLMEISTEPDIRSPEHAREVAELIAEPLISSGWVRKGADEIRQDVNFSMGFGRVEIKGVQKLSEIEDSIRYEMERQRCLERLSLKLRNIANYEVSLINSGSIFKDTSSGILKKSISHGMTVFIGKLAGYSGLLKNGENRLGKELSDVVKAFGGGGLMHSDELPAFGISREIDFIKDKLGCRNGDAFVIVTSPIGKIQLIENEMSERIRKISRMELSETRYMNSDGTTSFLRPLPGGSRMYPETDIPIIVVSRILDEASRIVPLSVKENAEKLVSDYGISAQDADTIIRRGYLSYFVSIADSIGNSSLAVFALLHMPHAASKNGTEMFNPGGVSQLLSELRENVKDRETLEIAISAYFEKNLSTNEIRKLIEGRRLKWDELKRIIEDLIMTGDVSEKNLIPRIRTVTSKIFSPRDAIDIYRKKMEKEL
ncbi:MAG: Glu-tRNA(Gln) amidotransferase subunit GatE [Candidatus Thermoplasmatota archaeon]|nr:Glu-tRNA(Gln) amidotransferase subunit GatE [Candidatus Thermoplasmatota archaeon]